MKKLIEMLEEGYEMTRVEDAVDTTTYTLEGSDYTLTFTNIANDNDFDADDVLATLYDDVIDIIEALENDDDTETEGTVSDRNFNEILFTIE